MKNPIQYFFPAAAVAAIFASSLHAVETDPVGYVTISLPAGSDTAVAFPLHPAPTFQGSVASVNAGAATITVSGNPGWTSDQFVSAADPMFLRVNGGLGAGMSLTVTGNSSDTVTVELEQGDDLSSVSPGDSVSLIPYWTAGKLVDSGPDNLQLFLYDPSIIGTNLSSSQILIMSSGDWYDSVTFSLANNTIIHPEESVLFRNSSATSYNLTLSGSVPTADHRLPLATLADNTAQDIRIAYNSPAETPIGQAGWDGLNDGDQLLVFDNSIIGTNKAASQILIYSGGDWYDSVSFSNVSSTFNLKPGTGYVFRKAATTSPETVIWNDTQSYRQ